MSLQAIRQSRQVLAVTVTCFENFTQEMDNGLLISKQLLNLSYHATLNTPLIPYYIKNVPSIPVERCTSKTRHKTSLGGTRNRDT